MKMVCGASDRWHGESLRKHALSGDAMKKDLEKIPFDALKEELRSLKERCKREP